MIDPNDPNTVKFLNRWGVVFDVIVVAVAALGLGAAGKEAQRAVGIFAGLICAALAVSSLWWRFRPRGGG